MIAKTNHVDRFQVSDSHNRAFTEIRVPVCRLYALAIAGWIREKSGMAVRELSDVSSGHKSNVSCLTWYLSSNVLQE